jgi:Organic solute transporter Ostalpha
MWIQIIYNFTYGAALLGLIHFWAGTRTLLKPYKPVWKFLTVKGVVFITFWQGLVLSLVLISQPEYKPKQLQTWLLCIEMLPAAVAMWFAFPAGPYMNAQRNREQGGIMMAVQNVGNVVTFTDVVTDLKHQARRTSRLTCISDGTACRRKQHACASMDGVPSASGCRFLIDHIVCDESLMKAHATRQLLYLQRRQSKYMQRGGILPRACTLPRRHAVQTHRRRVQACKCRAYGASGPWFRRYRLELHVVCMPSVMSWRCATRRYRRAPVCHNRLLKKFHKFTHLHTNAHCCAVCATVQHVHVLQGRRPG